MVRKVKLDLLEIDPHELNRGEISTDHEVTSEEGRPSGLRGRFGKLAVIGSLLFLVFSIGLTVWYQTAKIKPETRESAVSASSLAVGDGLEHFHNFAIDLKDEQGNYKVLLCDVALELNKGAKLSQEPANIRKVIYKTLQAKTIESLTAGKGKKALKKELESELDKTLGGQAVKQVFFTRFTLL